jgi:hypothetical protein
LHRKDENTGGSQNAGKERLSGNEKPVPAGKRPKEIKSRVSELLDPGSFWGSESTSDAVDLEDEITQPDAPQKPHAIPASNSPARFHKVGALPPLSIPSPEVLKTVKGGAAHSNIERSESARILLSMISVACLFGFLGWFLIGRNAGDPGEGWSAAPDASDASMDVDASGSVLMRELDGGSAWSEANDAGERKEKVEDAGMGDANVDGPDVDASSHGCVAGQGWIYVTTVPAGARVMLNKRPLPGKTPLVQTVCSGATHRISIELEGHSTVQKNILVRTNDVVNLNIELPK